jgi:pyruvate/2-oxoglutarate dehydrogenase complex dihydrolipoamide dehydrogenase (E3) component
MTDHSPAYDFIVIGGGSAGYAAARTAVELGLKTAVVDGGSQLGGLCILRGCMPTKSLLETAHRKFEIERASEFGLKVSGSVKANWKKVVARKDELIEEFASYRRDQLKSSAFDFYRARATFTDEYTLKLTAVETSGTKLPAQIQAKAFLVATGSTIPQPPIPGLAEAGFLTSDDAIHLTRPPKSIAVLGGGPIAVEFADYFHKMGIKVTLIQRSAHILKSMDNEVSAEVEASFRAEGMKVFTGTQLKSVSVSKSGKQKMVSFEHAGEKCRVKVKEIFFGLGRTPHTRGLGLEAAGVELRSRTISANRKMQTSQPHIFAAGDVCGPYEVVHVAIQQGEVAARNAAVLLGKAKPELKMESVDYRVPMEIIFCDPEVAAVGLTEAAARKRGMQVEAAAYPFNDHGKSIIMGAKFGFVKCVANAKTGRIVGAQIVGPHASDLIHEFAMAVALNVTVERFLKVPHYHPTLAEIVTYPVEEIAEKLGRI